MLVKGITSSNRKNPGGIYGEGEVILYKGDRGMFIDANVGGIELRDLRFIGVGGTFFEKLRAMKHLAKYVFSP